MKRLKDTVIWIVRGFSLKSFVLGVICTAVIAALAALLFFFLPFSPRPQRPDSLAAMKKVSEIEDLIRARYIGEVDEEAQTQSMLVGLVQGLDDRYAAYYSEEEFEAVLQKQSGKMKGIGITIAQDIESGELRIVYVTEDSPAEKAGVLEGDVILAVNGEDMAGYTSEEAAAAIQAEDGPVTLRLRRGTEEEPLELTMEKDEIRMTSVNGTMLDGGIGYIRITTFNGLTSEQFAEIYGGLREQGLNGLIIDLRDNLGGLVSACCDTASQILPEGPILYEQDRTGGERHKDCAGEDPIDIPLVLLVNGYTASASEIFTGAVRDYDIATIVGEQTYGKGVEQNTYTLSDGSALKLTTTVYYTPDHEDINGTGITPDEVVPLTEEDTTDVQMERALEILLEQTGDDAPAEEAG